MTSVAPPGHAPEVTGISAIRGEASRTDASSKVRLVEPPQSGKLIAQHSTRVWRSLRYLGVPEQDLADACQEVFLVMHRRWQEFRGESSYETWVYGICVGVARNVRRSGRRRSARHSTEEVEPACDPTVERDLDLERTRAHLHRALSELTPEQREVFVLREIEEVPMTAVAHSVGCPLFTAYARNRAARNKIKDLLGKLRGQP